jgi:hypothetical protein
MSAYREPTELASEPPDPEVLALGVLGRRATRVRIAIALPTLLGGLAFGLAAYMFVRGALFGSLGANSPYVTGAVTVLPAFALSWRIAATLSRAVVRWRAPAWVAEVALRHGVARDALRDFLRAFE